MIKMIVLASAIAIAASPARATNVPAWCPNSGYDNGPPRSRGQETDRLGKASQPTANRFGATAATAERIQIRAFDWG
jgi:hypothetical protein